MHTYLHTDANASVFCFGEKKKAHIPTTLEYSAGDAAAAGKVSGRTSSHSLAEFAQHAPAPSEDLVRGMV